MSPVVTLPRRPRAQKRSMANIESEKVRKTLIEYITIRCSTRPPVYSSAASAASPISMMPLRVVRRSESALKRCGIQLSIAMLERTRGPSMNPACAATTRSAPSEISVTTRKTPPNGSAPTIRSTSTAFIVLPGVGTTCQRR